MTTYLGTVDGYTGVIKFQNESVNQCRVFLNEHGLDCTHKGWEGEDKVGAIYYNGRGQGWTAAYWYKDNVKLVALV
jgi:hypothetical protein